MASSQSDMKTSGEAAHARRSARISKHFSGVLSPAQVAMLLDTWGNEDNATEETLNESQHVKSPPSPVQEDMQERPRKHTDAHDTETGQENARQTPGKHHDHKPSYKPVFEDIVEHLNEVIDYQQLRPGAVKMTPELLCLFKKAVAFVEAADTEALARAEGRYLFDLINTLPPPHETILLLNRNMYLYLSHLGIDELEEELKQIPGLNPEVDWKLYYAAWREYVYALEIQRYKLMTCGQLRVILDFYREKDRSTLTFNDLSTIEYVATALMAADPEYHFDRKRSRHCIVM